MRTVINPARRKPSDCLPAAVCTFFCTSGSVRQDCRNIFQNPLDNDWYQPSMHHMLSLLQEGTLWPAEWKTCNDIDGCGWIVRYFFFDRLHPWGRWVMSCSRRQRVTATLVCYTYATVGKPREGKYLCEGRLPLGEGGLLPQSERDLHL
jgi:hypothetical protein